ncbi:MAG TPA: ComEC/Rec2 family competence protein, partial [Bacteroidales bacterium]|nr:ComEC/Rec2 family competence protein [Bacteroidales bacterium]
LAISGLHVGIIWWVLDQLLRLPRHKRGWNRLKMILILFALWTFAAVAGFSQSVVRAVSMFSLVSLGRTVLRHSNIYQTLLLSAFVLLTMNPWRILEAGFQLSYLAVLGIVSIHPVISQRIAPRNKILKWITDLLTVSFAAQLATMPLSLHYFHSFPTYFFITNLVAIPLVSVILGSFLLLLPFIILLPQFDFASDLPLNFTKLLNHAVTFISELPGSSIEMIPMPGQVMVLLIMGLFCLILCLYYRKTYFIITAILIYTVAIALKPVSSSLERNNHELELANFKRSTVLTALKGSQRETVVISQAPENDEYVQKYIKKLSFNPFYLINHHVQLLAVNDSASKGNVVSLARQLWTVKLSGNDILVVGKCNKRKLEAVLNLHAWDILICRSGTSLRPQMADLINETTILAGDATLWDYECRNLATWFPGMHLVRKKGALKINTVKKNIKPLD